MLKILCLCLFVAKCINGNFGYGYDDDAIKRKMLSLFEENSWVMSQDHDELDFDTRIQNTRIQNPRITIIEPHIVRTYITDISVQQMSHPYLFKIIQMVPIKWKISFQYIFQKLFQFYIALQNYRPSVFNFQTIQQMLSYIFPDIPNEQLVMISHKPVGPSLLRALFMVIFPALPRQDMEFIFRGATTSQEVVINLILNLCPNIRETVQWSDSLPPQSKLDLIFDVLFPGVSIKYLIPPDGNFLQRFEAFLDVLFKGKLTSYSGPNLQGPEWWEFQNLLTQYHIDFNLIPQDYIYYLFAIYRHPEFKEMLPKIREKFQPKNNKMDADTLRLWKQFLVDLRSHQKTLYDMPQQIRIFLQKYDNPKELIQDLSDSLGFDVDPGKLNIPLDPTIMELWKKFILDLMNHKGDSTHLPKPLIDYFWNLSQNPNYKLHLNDIFDGLLINPKLAIKWNIFFTQLQDGQTTLDEMPNDLKIYLMQNPNPEQFLQIILKLRDAKFETKLLDIQPNPELILLWKQYVQDVAEHKGSLKNIPPKLLKYFYELASNPAYVEYIKLIFGPDRISPKLLATWKNFISKLRTHQVDLKDMPTELIQLMLKYKSPEEFFKLVVPNADMQKPNQVVQQKWQDWTQHLQNTSIYDTPQELRDYINHLSPSQDYKDLLRDIYSINPNILASWKQFVWKLKQHTTSLAKLPEDLKDYIIRMNSPKDFIKLIFEGLERPINYPIPEPTLLILEQWKSFKKMLQKPILFIFLPELFKYIRYACMNNKYQLEVNYILQIDSSVRQKLEDFKNNLANDYNTTLQDMDLGGKMYLKAWMLHPDEALMEVLGAYNGEESLNPLLPAQLKSWLTHFGTINPTSIGIINSLVQGSMLEPKVNEVLDMIQKNKLVINTENFWQMAKQEVRPNNGEQVFLLFLEKFGQHYAKSKELCVTKRLIIDALKKLMAQLEPDMGCF